MERKKESPELNRLGDAKECASQKPHGNANANSNPLALKLAVESQL